MEKLMPVQVTTNVGSIEDNLSLVEASIKEKVAEYKAVVITEDTITDGKNFLAEIRKEKTALDQQRKDIKKAWMKPYECFEKKAKAIISLYDEPISVINGQLDSYEQTRREEKRQEIKATYDFVKGDLEEWLPLSKIYDSRWENKTCSGKKIREDMELIFDQMKLSISTVKELHSEFEADALEVLKRTGSLQEAIAKVNELKAQKERFAEQARIEAEKEMERRRMEEEKKNAPVPAPEPIPEAAPAEPDVAFEEAPFDKVPVADEEDAPFALQKILTVTCKVSENSLETVEMFLNSLGIEYEVK